MTRAKTHADVRRGDGPVAPGKGRSAAPGDAPRDDAPPRCAASDGRQRAGVAAPRVGAAYQVPAASLPDPRHGPARPRSSRASPVRVWDATRARAATRAVDLLERIVPRERRERALALLHRHDYEITDGESPACARNEKYNCCVCRTEMGRLLDAAVLTCVVGTPPPSPPSRQRS